MRKFYILFIAMLSATLAMAENTISIPAIEITPGETKTVEVYLNSEGMSGKQFGFDVELPEYVSFVGENGNGKFYDCVQGLPNFISVKKQTNGDLRFGAMGVTIAAGEKLPVASFDIVAADEFEGGEIIFKSINIAGDKTQGTANVAVTVKSDPVENPQGIYIKDFSIKPEGSAVVTVYLNWTAISSKQVGCDLKLSGEGLEWDGDANGSFDSRVSGLPNFMGIKIQTNGDLRIGTMGVSIPEGDDVFATFKVKTTEKFKGGTITIYNINVEGNKLDPIEVKVTADSTDGINNAIVNIENNAVVYNIAGQRVNANAKGIIIKNGKKFIAQ